MAGHFGFYKISTNKFNKGCYLSHKPLVYPKKVYMDINSHLDIHIFYFGLFKNYEVMHNRKMMANTKGIKHKRVKSIIAYRAYQKMKFDRIYHGRSAIELQGFLKKQRVELCYKLLYTVYYKETRTNKPIIYHYLFDENGKKWFVCFYDQNKHTTLYNEETNEFFIDKVYYYTIDGENTLNSHYNLPLYDEFSKEYPDLCESYNEWYNRD
jgi:hypothetical protein